MAPRRLRLRPARHVERHRVSPELPAGSSGSSPKELRTFLPHSRFDSGGYLAQLPRSEAVMSVRRGCASGRRDMSSVTASLPSSRPATPAAAPKSYEPSCHELRWKLGSAVKIRGGQSVQALPASVSLPGDGAEVIVGVRPQHLPASAGDLLLKADIRERLGGVASDYLTTPTGERLIVEARGDEDIPSGSPVQVSCEPGKPMFFDAATEARLRRRTSGPGLRPGRPIGSRRSMGASSVTG